MANTMPTNVQLTVCSYGGDVIANSGCPPLPPPQKPSRPKPSPVPEQQHQQQQQLQQQQHQLLNAEAALSYLDQVKFKLRSQPEVYKKFLHVMKEFKSQSVDTLAVIERVTDLLKDHPELIIGFTTILAPTRKKVQDVYSYLDQIRYKFANHPQVYYEFIEIMRKYKIQSVDISTVIHTVSNLFKGHTDLIIGFITFLPPGYKIEVQSDNQGYTFQISFSMPSSVMDDPATAVASAGRPLPAAPPVAASFSSVPAPSASACSSVASKTSLQQQLQQSPAHSISPVPRAQHALIQAGQFDDAINYLCKRSRSTNRASTSETVTQLEEISSSVISEHDSTVAQDAYNIPIVTEHPSASSSETLNHVKSEINTDEKIEERFISESEKYERFLEILNNYQKEQERVKNGHDNTIRHFTEAEVYSQVARLFQK